MNLSLNQKVRIVQPNGIIEAGIVESVPSATGAVKCITFTQTNNGEVSLPIDSMINNGFKITVDNEIEITSMSSSIQWVRASQTFNSHIADLGLKQEDVIVSHDAGMIYLEKGMTTEQNLFSITNKLANFNMMRAFFKRLNKSMALNVDHVVKYIKEYLTDEFKDYFEFTPYTPNPQNEIDCTLDYDVDEVEVVAEDGLIYIQVDGVFEREINTTSKITLDAVNKLIEELIEEVQDRRIRSASNNY